jgi:nucleotide-binding universal stress UspA family protein
MNNQFVRAPVVPIAGRAGKPPAKPWVVVVGYDGSPAAGRALDQAVEMLRNRDGAIEVVYVTNPPGSANLAADTLAGALQGLEKQTATLASDVRRQLVGRELSWHFQRGGVRSELIISVGSSVVRADHYPVVVVP